MYKHGRGVSLSLQFFYFHFDSCLLELRHLYLSSRLYLGDRFGTSSLLLFVLASGKSVIFLGVHLCSVDSNADILLLTDIWERLILGFFQGLQRNYGNP